MQIGQAVEVVAKGSPFFGERGTLASLPDAENCVHVTMDHIAKIGGADMAPVALSYRFPVEQLELGEEPPAPPVDTEPMGRASDEEEPAVEPEETP